MAIFQEQHGIRSRPISSRLEALLNSASSSAGVDVHVFSGGQAAKGSKGSWGKRTGSTRHDLGNAADLSLWQDGRQLLESNPKDLAIIQEFVKAAVENGATGIGGGTGYMGNGKLHVGFDRSEKKGAGLTLWGPGETSKTTPKWLRDAVSGKALALRDLPVNPAADPFGVVRMKTAKDAASDMAAGKASRPLRLTGSPGKGRMFGPDVAALGEKLKGLGYDTGTPANVYGPKMAAAVRAYQTANGLNPDSVAGPLTIAKLNPAAPAYAPGGGEIAAPAYSPGGGEIAPPAYSPGGGVMPTDPGDAALESAMGPSGIPPMAFAPPPMGAGWSAAPPGGMPVPTSSIGPDPTYADDAVLAAARGQPDDLPWSDGLPPNPGAPYDGTRGRPDASRFSPAGARAAMASLATRAERAGAQPAIAPANDPIGSALAASPNPGADAIVPRPTPRPETALGGPSYGPQSEPWRDQWRVAGGFGVEPSSAPASPQAWQPGTDLSQLYPWAGDMPSAPDGGTSINDLISGVQRIPGYLGDAAMSSAGAVGGGIGSAVDWARRGLGIDPAPAAPPLAPAVPPDDGYGGYIPGGYDYMRQDQPQQQSYYYTPPTGGLDGMAQTVSADPSFVPGGASMISGSGGNDTLIGSAGYPGFPGPGLSPAVGAFRSKPLGFNDAFSIPGASAADAPPSPSMTSSYPYSVPPAPPPNSFGAGLSFPSGLGYTPPRKIDAGGTGAKIKQAIADGKRAAGVTGAGRSGVTIGAPGGVPYFGQSPGSYSYSGTTPWGSNTYTTPSGGFSNSPFTPSGWTPPSFDSISGGPTYAYHSNGDGTGSYVDSNGNIHQY